MFKNKIGFLINDDFVIINIFVMLDEFKVINMEYCIWKSGIKFGFRNDQNIKIFFDKLLFNFIEFEISYVVNIYMIKFNF